MLFPTIRFAIFFAIVMPASWYLMPLAGTRGRSGDRDLSQPWVAPIGLLGAAALLGPLAPAGWPGPLRVGGWLAALALAGLAAVRWIDLVGLARWSVFILVASYVFYGNYDWHFVLLLIASTIVNQAIARSIDRNGQERIRRMLLAAGVVANLGVLAWFKYKGFFSESASSILAPLGIDFEPPARALIPPVGISFFTFQALSYVIDIYRRKLRPAPLLDFAVYLSFFPHLVAGPIVRAAEFLPQLRVPRDARRIDSGLAFWLIAVGLFKKVVVSSYLADAIVDPVFRIPSQHQAADTLLGIYGYAIQIYCDFSGYTDMAIGLALLLGFRFPQNFDAPYTAASLQEFWRRWHMTLSRWLRDYLYIPLGGNQRGPRRAYLNLFLTMLIGGLWHGAAWTFVVWGALHGGYLAAERWWSGRPRPAPAGSLETPVDPSAPAKVPVKAFAPGGSDTGEASGTSWGDQDDAGDRAHGGSTAVVSELVEDPAMALGEDPGANHPLGRPMPTLAHLRPLSPTARLWLGRLLTFHVVCLGWVFFRAPTMSGAFEVLGRLLQFGTGTGVNLVVVATIATFIATQFVPTHAVGKAQAWFSRAPAWQQGMLLALFLMFTNALSPTGVAPFIYFAF